MTSFFAVTNAAARLLRAEARDQLGRVVVLVVQLTAGARVDDLIGVAAGTGAEIVETGLELGLELRQPGHLSARLRELVAQQLFDLRHRERRRAALAPLARKIL